MEFAKAVQVLVDAGLKPVSRSDPFAPNTYGKLAVMNLEMSCLAFSSDFRCV